METIKEAFAKHHKGEDAEPYEYVLVSKNGKRIPVVILTELKTWNGKPAILGNVSDISDFKHLEAQIRESEEKYRLLLDSSQDAVFGIKDMRFVYINQGAVEMLGYDSKNELLSTPLINIVAPEHRELVRERTIARLTGESPSNMYEVNLLRKDGGKVIIEFNISLIEFEGGPMNLTFARDVSELVQHMRVCSAIEREWFNSESREYEAEYPC